MTAITDIMHKPNPIRNQFILGGGGRDARWVAGLPMVLPGTAMRLGYHSNNPAFLDLPLVYGWVAMKGGHP